MWCLACSGGGEKTECVRKQQGIKIKRTMIPLRLPIILFLKALGSVIQYGNVVQLLHIKSNKWEFASLGVYEQPHHSMCSIISNSAFLSFHSTIIISYSATSVLFALSQGDIVPRYLTVNKRLPALLEKNAMRVCPSNAGHGEGGIYSLLQRFIDSDKVQSWCLGQPWPVWKWG